MNDIEHYLFDLQGYIHIPQMLTRQEAARLDEATRRLEQDALSCRDGASRWKAVWGPEYWQSPEQGYFAWGEAAEGKTLMVEDFWLYPKAFDFLIGHERTMSYIRRIVQGPIGINNSELRIRYTKNFTGMHMGYGPGTKPKYAYQVVDGQISCIMVRMIYFPHDVGPEDGPTCFVPGSHRGALPRPAEPPLADDEPGVVGVPAQAGDAILFTEACRHGGLQNRGPRTRYTLHVGYGPQFLKSQNISTVEEDVNVTDALLTRLSPAQRELLVGPRRQAVPSTTPS